MRLHSRYIRTWAAVTWGLSGAGVSIFILAWLSARGLSPPPCGPLHGIWLPPEWVIETEKDQNRSYCAFCNHHFYHILSATQTNPPTMCVGLHRSMDIRRWGSLGIILESDQHSYHYSCAKGAPNISKWLHSHCRYYRRIFEQQSIWTKRTLCLPRCT